MIWQYWETSNFKPLFVDGLHEIAKKNSGVDVVLVTPDTVSDYIPDIPEMIFEIKELAHKADMIRALLLYHNGGMWLDSDAIVLSDLNWMFDELGNYDFVGFNDSGSFIDEPLKVRINCFLARPKSNIMKTWVKYQHQKFPKIRYTWTEIGTDLLDPIIIENKRKVKLLPFDMICPVRWDEVSRFSSVVEDADDLLNDTQMVMLSNKSLQTLNPALTITPLNELSKGKTLIAGILRRALSRR